MRVSDLTRADNVRALDQQQLDLISRAKRKGK